MRRLLGQFSQRQLLWITVLAVFVPLGLLLMLQYRTLSSLAEASAIAEKAQLTNYLQAVADKTTHFYRSQANRALDIPAEYFRDLHPSKIAKLFHKKQPKGAKLLFAIKYTDEHWSRTSYYDPRTGSEQDPDADVYRAIQVATAQWKILANKGSELKAASLGVNERDPDNRVIVYPIALGEKCRIIGVAGMIVDNDYFAEVVLPGTVEAALPRFFSGEIQNEIVTNVVDERGRLIYGDGSGWHASDEAVRLDFPFIFTDWAISLQKFAEPPEQVAKANFLLNISISVLLAGTLLGGILWTLKTASREMYLSQMKTDFVSNVSHELRTPLASIRVFGEFLRLGRVREGEKMREYGEYIETESTRLTGLINNILDFSRIESGVKTYNIEPADLAETVRETIRTLQLSLKHRGFELRYEERGGPPFPVVDVDPGAIAQALSNLVDNAVKYSGDEREVTVRLARGPAHLSIDVEDRGIGISPDEQKKIFERFHRVSTGLVHDVKGAGLGLSIVNHVMSAHGGRVVVESEPGRGSRFTLELPLRPGADVATGADPSAATVAG